MVTPGPMGGDYWFLALIRLSPPTQSPLPRISLAIVGAGCRPHHLKQKTRVSPNAIRLANLAFLPVDRSLVSPFAGNRASVSPKSNQPALYFFSISPRRSFTRRTAVMLVAVIDPVRRGGNSLQRLRSRARSWSSDRFCSGRESMRMLHISRRRCSLESRRPTSLFRERHRRGN